MKSIQVYNVHELKEMHPDGFKYAHEHWVNNNYEIFWMEEIVESLKKLFEMADIRLKDWSLGIERSYVKFEMDENVRELSGQRALAWLENNLLWKLRIPWRGEKRWKISKYGKYYRAGNIRPCPLTGYFADEVYLNYLIEEVKNGHELGDVFSWLADKCQELIYNEWKGQCEEEYFIDHAYVNEFEFLENGHRV